jgi:hypothetical protein
VERGNRLGVVDDLVDPLPDVHRRSLTRGRNRFCSDC